MNIQHVINYLESVVEHEMGDVEPGPLGAENALRAARDVAAAISESRRLLYEVASPNN